MTVNVFSFELGPTNQFIQTSVIYFECISIFKIIYQRNILDVVNEFLF